MRALKKIPGAKVLFGGELLDPSTHSIPACYGSFQPTAIQVRGGAYLQLKVPPFV